EHVCQAVLDDLGGIGDDAVDEFFVGRDVVDNALNHTHGPLAGFNVAVFEDLASTCSGNQVLDVFELATIVEDLDGFGGDLVLADPYGVAQWAEVQDGVQLAAIDDGLLDVFVNRGFSSSHEPGSHVNPVGT